MRRLGSSSAIVFAGLALGSCSLERIDVTPCLAGRHLGFELGTLSRWFGLAQVHPRPNDIWIAYTSGAKPLDVWEVVPDVDAEQERRALVWYGQHLKGTKIETSPKRLRAGGRYRIWIRDGGHKGYAEFVLTAELPACNVKEA